MSAIKANQIRPIAETVQEKTAVFVHQGLKTAICDLQYRPAVTFSLKDRLAMIVLPMLASALAVPIAYSFGHFIAPYISSWYYAIAAAGLGVILAAAHQLARLKKTPSRNVRPIDLTAIVYLFLPVFLWLAIAMLEHINEPAGACGYLLAVTLPGLLVFADRIATHAVYWMTANTKLDYRTSRTWRDDWRFRFVPIARLFIDEEDGSDLLLRRAYTVAAETRFVYCVGLIWVFLAVSIPGCIILATSPSPARPTIGMEMLVGFVCGLLIVAMIRSDGRISMFITFCRHVCHWFCYDVGRTMPPWVFRTPCGSLRRRRLWVILAVIMTAIPLYYLASGSVFYLLTRCYAAVDCSPTIEEDTNFDIQPKSASSVEIHNIPNSLILFVIYLALAAIVSTTVPVVACFLVVFILIGPILWAYYNFLES